MAFSDDLKQKLARFEQPWILRLTVRTVCSQSDPATFIPWAQGNLPPADPAMDGVAYWGLSCPRVRDAADPFPDFYIDPMSLKMPEQRLDLGNWTCNGGQWSIEVQDNLGTDQASWLVPGQYVELALGCPGYAHADFGRIAVGFIANVTKLERARLRIVVYDLLAMLNGDVFALRVPYGDPAIVRNLGSAYTAGDTSIVMSSGAAAADFDDYADKDGTYTLVLVPDSGDPFILKAGSRTGDTFNDVTPTGEFGTTAADTTDTGTARVRCAYRLQGHPLLVVPRMLASTGTGTNGTHDVEPSQVGYGVPDELIDSADLTIWRAVVDPPTDNFTVEFPIADLGTTTSGDRPTTLTEGLREFHRRLGQAGIWICQRQGQITCRALQDLDASPQMSGITVSIRNVIPGTLECEWYVAERSEEIAGVRVATADAAASTSSSDNQPRLALMRTSANEPLDTSSIIQVNGATGEVADSILARVAPWNRERLMRIRCSLAGLQWMQLAVGDVVSVDFSAGFPGMGGESPLVMARGRTADVDGDAAGGTAGQIVTWPMMVERVLSLLPAPAVALSFLYAPPRGQDWLPAVPSGTPGGQVPLL